MRRRFLEALEELEQLRDALSRARRDIDEAVVQTGIDSLLTVVTALLAWALYEGAARRARSTAVAYRSSEGEYRVLLRELSSNR